MNMPIQAELPEKLINKAQELVQAGWENDLDDLLADALRRYLESHSVALADQFIQDDVQWGLFGSD
jgi:Arc/MetJ-type ribon-helix-helix transcriptional regulator